ncbi:sensor histidine kinase [Leptothrix discophora]|uniref:histidine kinase n=1 Tax=Leptothrix discophora TaxID=89 RepID=A0ABT9G751_LEPDI|nr:ATP-binding protein [Leptothrix discophora]MDP4302302.1 ATP-binding protein [Leptothrix discophora]
MTVPGGQAKANTDTGADTVPAEEWAAHPDAAPAPVERPDGRDVRDEGPDTSGYTTPPVIEPLPADRLRKGPPKAFLRIFRGFIIARALLAVLLLAMQAVVAIYGSSGSTLLALAICAGYALATLVLVAQVELRRLPTRRAPLDLRGHLLPHWRWVTIGVDLASFTALLVVSLSGPLNLNALFLLPVLTAGALMPRRTAAAVAASVVLLMLGGAWWRVLAGSDMATQLTQSGMFGAMVFALALLTAEMADRLTRQEAAARSTLEMARQQAMLNRLMIEEMQDGVMVVDADGHVRAANPAAMALIGAPPGRRFMTFDLRQHEAWEPLWLALERAWATGFWPDGGEEIRLRLSQGAKVEERGLRLRMRFTRRHDSGEDPAAQPPGHPAGESLLCVLFMDDVRTLQARARQEKLAAMGRVSAGIAHEIRNPLAAIAQANALLSEDLMQPAQRQLTRMVADNVVRLQRIVDDVMEVAPGAPREAPVIDLSAQVQMLCADWGRTAGLPQLGPSPLMVDAGDGVLPVRFDPDHLRRVLVNLLDNAHRHGSARADALWVRVHARGESQVVVSVASDGAPIAPDVEPYLFEPFFSTRSRGSGLGLYICRELCERYGATIEYHPRGPGARHRNVFVMTLPRMVPVSPPMRPGPAWPGAMS